MEQTKKYTWHEAREFLTKFNKKHSYTAKGYCTELIVMVAVIKADSFSKPYTEIQRSFAFTNDNQAFLPNKISNSIYADCLDGQDLDVRLDWYIPSDWQVDYCYIKEN